MEKESAVGPVRERNGSNGAAALEAILDVADFNDRVVGAYNDGS